MSKGRPYEHIKSQKKIKELEGYQCMVCGIVSKKSAGHHLIPYSEEGSADLINFITLCVDCHKKYHQGKLKVDIHRF